MLDQPTPTVLFPFWTTLQTDRTESASIFWNLCFFFFLFASQKNRSLVIEYSGRILLPPNEKQRMYVLPLGVSRSFMWKITEWRLWLFEDLLNTAGNTARPALSTCVHWNIVTHTHMHTHQTHRHADIRTRMIHPGRNTNTHTHKDINRLAWTHAGALVHAFMHVHTHTYTCKQTHCAHTDAQAHTETHTQRQTHTHKQTHTHTQTDTYTHTHTHSHSLSIHTAFELWERNLRMLPRPEMMNVILIFLKGQYMP